MIEAIKAELRRRIKRLVTDVTIPIDELYCNTIKANELRSVLSFIESLEKEQHLTKRNKLFDECVANCDPATMKEVSDNIDKMLEKEQPKRKLRKVCNLREDLKDDKPLEERLEELRQIRTEKDRLDEAAEEYVKDDALKPWRNLCKEAYKDGAKWQYQKDRFEFAKLKAKEWQEGYYEGAKLQARQDLAIVQNNIGRAAKCMEQSTGFEEYPYWDGAHDMANAIRRELEGVEIITALK